MSDLLDRLRAATEGVTPGTWCVSNSKLIRVASYQTSGHAPVVCGVHRIGFLNGKGDPGDPLANARFIAAARDLIPEAAAEIARLQARIAVLEGRNE